MCLHTSLSPIGHRRPKILPKIAPSPKNSLFSGTNHFLTEFHCSPYHRLLSHRNGLFSGEPLNGDWIRPHPYSACKNRPTHRGKSSEMAKTKQKISFFPKRIDKKKKKGGMKEYTYRLGCSENSLKNLIQHSFNPIPHSLSQKHKIKKTKPKPLQS